MCKILRVLNAVRDPEIGMPLTVKQYKVCIAFRFRIEHFLYLCYLIYSMGLFAFCVPQLLTATVLIGRLINANQHLLALRISEYLNLNPVSAFFFSFAFFCCDFCSDIDKYCVDLHNIVLNNSPNAQ